ncbi:MAG: D-lyxose/D-mannose family sugar isomerase [Devosiaceae bacterium]|nr:D-lyxose/D-mannose family sugar isomerase [Devosiaceae bacterium]
MTSPPMTRSRINRIIRVGEISTVNDDNEDNFYENSAITRFSGIIEDEEPLRLLVSDYKDWL